MEKVFDDLIVAFAKNSIGISNEFLSPFLLSELKINLLKLKTLGKLKLAGTGIKATINQRLNVRGDQISWLDRCHNNKAENQFLDIIDTFILYLNSSIAL